MRGWNSNLRGLPPFALSRDVRLGWTWYSQDAPPGCLWEGGAIPHPLRVMIGELCLDWHEEAGRSAKALLSLLYRVEQIPDLFSMSPGLGLYRKTAFLQRGGTLSTSSTSLLVVGEPVWLSGVVCCVVLFHRDRKHVYRMSLGLLTLLPLCAWKLV